MTLCRTGLLARKRPESASAAAGSVVERTAVTIPHRRRLRRLAQAICPLNPLRCRVDRRVVALHETLTEQASRPLVTCPLCGQQYLVAADYKVHLDESHRLTDDAGTDTELSLMPPAPPAEEPAPEPEPAARSRWGRGSKP